MCASEIKKRNVHGTFRTPDGIKKTHSDYTIPEPEKQGKHGILQIPFHLDSSIKLMHIPERTKGKMAYIENRFFVGGRRSIPGDTERGFRYRKKQSRLRRRSGK